MLLSPNEVLVSDLYETQYVPLTTRLAAHSLTEPFLIDLETSKGNGDWHLVVLCEDGNKPTIHLPWQCEQTLLVDLSVVKGVILQVSFYYRGIKMLTVDNSQQLSHS